MKKTKRVSIKTHARSLMTKSEIRGHIPAFNSKGFILEKQAREEKVRRTEDKQHYLSVIRKMAKEPTLPIPLKNGMIYREQLDSETGKMMSYLRFPYAGQLFKSAWEKDMNPLSQRQKFFIGMQDIRMHIAIYEEQQKPKAQIKLVKGGENNGEKDSETELVK